MEFDKARCYSALNADELKPGDKVIVADCMTDLKRKVKSNENIHVHELVSVHPEDEASRFCVRGCYSEVVYLLAYLVERKENCTNCAELGKAGGCCPLDDDDGKTTRCWLYKPKTERAEKKYRPFANTDELIKVWCEKGGKWQKRELTMPHIWVRHKGAKEGVGVVITAFYIHELVIKGNYYSMQTLFDKFTFLDGSVCGVEE